MRIVFDKLSYGQFLPFICELERWWGRAKFWLKWQLEHNEFSISKILFFIGWKLKFRCVWVCVSNLLTLQQDFLFVLWFNRIFKSLTVCIKGIRLPAVQKHWCIRVCWFSMLRSDTNKHTRAHVFTLGQHEICDCLYYIAQSDTPDII